jgi:hypothetical protein
MQDSAMSLKPQETLSVPDETRRVAVAAFLKGCACLNIGDVMGCSFECYLGFLTRLGQLARRVPDRAVRTLRCRRLYLRRPHRPIAIAGEPIANLIAATSGTDSDWVSEIL